MKKVKMRKLLSIKINKYQSGFIKLTKRTLALILALSILVPSLFLTFLVQIFSNTIDIEHANNAIVI